MDGFRQNLQKCGSSVKHFGMLRIGDGHTCFDTSAQRDCRAIVLVRSHVSSWTLFNHYDIGHSPRLHCSNRDKPLGNNQLFLEDLFDLSCNMDYNPQHLLHDLDNDFRIQSSDAFYWNDLLFFNNDRWNRIGTNFDAI